MSHKQWSRLKKLIGAFSSREKDYFRSVALASLGRGQKHSKLIGLFDAIDREETLDEGQPAERKLMESLEHRVMDHLLHDVNLSRSRASNSSAPFIKLHKVYLKAVIFREREISQRAFSLADRCAKLAAKMENYSLALECFRLQLQLTSLHRQEEDFKAIVQQIDHYEDYQKQKNSAIRLYNELKLKKYLRILENLDYFIANSLDRLVKMQQRIDSDTVRFIFYYFQKEWNELEGLLDRAEASVLQMLELAQSIQGRDFEINKYELRFERAKLMLQAGQRMKARDSFVACVSNLPVESDIAQEAREYLFLMECASGNYLEGARLLHTFMTSAHFKEQLPDTHRLRWLFYLCCLLFVTKQPRRCLQRIERLYLTGRPELERNIYLRIMKVMCLIDEECFDRADREIDALRKFASRNSVNFLERGDEIKTFIDLLWGLRYIGYQMEKLDHEKLERVNELLIRYQGLPKEYQYCCGVILLGWFAEKLAFPEQENIDGALLFESFHRELLTLYQRSNIEAISREKGDL